ncbi:hypothetical protein M0R04_16245 [Candidatus Dojkabacteria bacterium]|nr:hypothetical protein [Candidatus Dojkabacteria bacterium]
MPRLCVECKYHRYSEELLWHLCTHPSIIKTDLVTGEKSYKICYELRQKSTERFTPYDHCGPLGKLWEPK